MDILNSFNEKVDRLDNSKLMLWVRDKGRKKPQDTDALSKNWLALHGLHPDDFDAFALNLRFLIQDRDGISIGSLKKFYNNLPQKYNEYKDEFKKKYTNLSEYLEQRSVLQIENKDLTNWGYFEIIFYGGVVHQNKDKKDYFKRFTNWGQLNGLTFFMFMNVLTNYLNFLKKFKILNEFLIKELK